MAKKRRSRSRKRRPGNQVETVQDWADEEDSPPKLEPGTVVIDEQTLRSVQNKVDLEEFKEHGFRCDRCGFVTKRRGLSGVQSLRAHTRLHVRNKRAIHRPMKIHGAVLLIALATAAMWLWVDPTPVADVVALPEMSNWYAQALALGLPVIVVSYTWDVTARFEKSGHRGLVRQIECGVLAGDLLVLAAAAVWPLLAANGLHWTWLIPAAAPPLLSGLLFSPNKNVILLAVQRRPFVPGGYRKVLKARTEEGDDQFNDFRSDLRRKIGDGRILLARLNKAEQRLLSSLGLGGLQPDPRLVERRLQAEARRTGSRRPGQGAQRGRRMTPQQAGRPRLPDPQLLPRHRDDRG